MPTYFGKRSSVKLLGYEQLVFGGGLSPLPASRRYVRGGENRAKVSVRAYVQK